MVGWLVRSKASARQVLICNWYWIGMSETGFPEPANNCLNPAGNGKSSFGVVESTPCINSCMKG